MLLLLPKVLWRMSVDLGRALWRIVPYVARKGRKFRRYVLRTADSRLKYYEPRIGRKDILLLDKLSFGNVDETLKEAWEKSKPGSLLYISDTTKLEGPPGPNRRRVFPQNVQRWMERVGFSHLRSRLEDGRCYVIAERPLESEESTHEDINVQSGSERVWRDADLDAYRSGRAYESQGPGGESGPRSDVLRVSSG